MYQCQEVLGPQGLRRFLRGSLLVASLVQVKRRSQGWGETRPGQSGFSNCSRLCVCSRGWQEEMLHTKAGRQRCSVAKAKAQPRLGQPEGLQHRGLGRQPPADAGTSHPSEGFHSGYQEGETDPDRVSHRGLRFSAPSTLLQIHNH